MGHSSGIDLDNELSERSLGGLDSSGLWERNPLLSMAALSVEHLKVRVYLLGGGGLDGGLNSRAPKGDGGLNSRAC